MAPKYRGNSAPKQNSGRLNEQVQTMFQHALALHQNGRTAEAQSAYLEVLNIEPRHFDSLHLLGVIAYQSDMLESGVKLISEAIGINPAAAAPHNNLGNALLKSGKFEEAVACYDRAISRNPEYANAYNNRGNALKELSRLEEGLRSCNRAIELKPDYANAYNNRGNIERALGVPAKALRSYEKALTLTPNDADIYVNMGIALSDLKLEEAALDCNEKAIALNPRSAEAFNNRGKTLKDLRRLDDAIESLQIALELKPNFVDAHLNLGITLAEMRRFDEGLYCYGKALEIRPDFAKAYLNRGLALMEMGRIEEALSDFEKGYEINPEAEFLLGILLHQKMSLCDWKGLDEHLEALARSILAGQKASPPFALIGLIDSPEIQRKASEIYVSANYPASNLPVEFAKKAKGQPIKIGYYSADFHNHATAYLMAELFESHSADKFELYGFSFGPQAQDEMQQRVSRAFDRFIDVSHISDRKVASLSRDLGIDIAVDLKGHTAHSRPGIFAAKCAPIQVNYLGYPGTLGAAYFDYMIADTTVISKQATPCYSEKIVYLPHCYQVNDSKKVISEQSFTHQELGLPESGFVFCCFNNSYKILPETFDCWMRILRAVEGSVLWLLEDSPTVVRNLRYEAQARGISGDRLIFAKRMPLADHLARHRCAHLFLDTLPCNAHTTASDALWAGLPLLTLQGEAFQARVAASLLHAVGLSELVMHSRQGYEAAAIALALDRTKLDAARNKLVTNRATSALFNTGLFVHHIESAFESMQTRYLAGMAPDHIWVQQ